MASAPPTGNITRNITVKVAVQGDKAAISALAALERAQAASINAQRRAAGIVRGNNKALGDMNSQLKTNRLATVQAGQQFQDFAIQVQGGQSPMVAFTQQISQLGFVMQGASGVFGTFGRFITGPWGTAIILATSLLLPLAKSLNDAKDASDKFPSSNLDKRLLAYAKTVGATAEDVKELEKRHVTLSDRAQAAFIVISEAARREFPNVFKIGGAVAEGLGKVFSLLGRGIVQAVATMVAVHTNMLNKLREIATPVINFLIDGFNRVSVFFAKSLGQEAYNIPKLEAYSAKMITAADVTAGFNKLLGDINIKAEDIAFDRLSGQLDEVAKKAGGAAGEAKKLNDEMAEWLRGLEDAANPARVFIREVDKLGKAYDAGLLSLEAYRLEYDRLLETLREARKELGQQAPVSFGTNNEGRLPSVANLPVLDIKLPEVNVKIISDLEKAYEQLGLVGVDAILGIGDAFADAINGAQSFADAMEGVARSVVAEITKILVKMALLEGLKAIFGGDSNFLSKVGSALFSAQGNVIQNGRQVTAFASGGIVGSPTIFPMARGGVGVMGEAGPEAIMPLRRNASGNLGVGAVQPVINIINNAGAQVSVSEDARAGEINVIIEQASQRIAADISRGDGRVARSLQGAYGLSRSRR
jgi:hypothetical protein